MIRTLVCLLLTVTYAHAQQAVKQSGTITPGHAAAWVAPGTIKDAGPATNGGLTSLGVTSNGGPAICVNSAPTTQPFNRLCFSVSTNGGATISSDALGGATTPGITFSVNGSAQGFPAVTGVPVTSDDLVCFDGTAGSLKDCGAAISNLPTGLSNVRLAKTANYTVANTDGNKTIALGGNSFFTLTFDAASGYDSVFQVRIVNEDGWSAGRGKAITINGIDTFILWPTQTITVYAQNNAWQTDRPARAKMENDQAMVINTDFDNGTDDFTVTDGLGTGTGAFKTANFGLLVAYGQFDFNTIHQSTITVRMASGVTDSQEIHVAPQGSAPGAQGGAAITLDGNGGTSSGGVATFFGVYLILTDLTIQNASGAGLSVERKSQVEIGPSMVFGPCPSNAQIYVDPGSRLYVNNSFSYSGNSDALLYSIFGFITADSVTATLTANVTYTTNTVYTQGGYAGLGAITWAAGGHTVTSTAYNVIANGVLEGSSNVPGTTPGTTASGGQAL